MWYTTGRILENCITKGTSLQPFSWIIKAHNLRGNSGNIWTHCPYTGSCFNLLTPNDDYSGRTALLTSKCCILYIYSTNTGTEYFKHGIYSPFFPLQNAVSFINLMYLVPVLFTIYIQNVLKLKK